MSSNPKRLKGLKVNSRSPSSIANSEHNDTVGACKEISGSSLAIDKILPDASTTAQSVGDCALIRVYNNTGSVQFIWAGDEGDEPGTADITNSVALAPNSVENFFLPPSSDDSKSVVVKTSAATVQVVKMKG